MIIFPAIDIRGGCAVRLKMGDYGKQTVYGDDPAAIAEKFASDGAEFLHLVDLDGAKEGAEKNFDVIKSIIPKIKDVEVGGGIRTEQTVDKYLSAGVRRVILGTSAISDRPFLEKMIKTYGDGIAVGVDIFKCKIAVSGWLEYSDVPYDQFFEYLCGIGCKTVIVTDISRDGMLSGSNLELYRQLNAKYDIDITASGGVSFEEEIKELADINIYGAILGKALYEGKLDLKRAIAISRGER